MASQDDAIERLLRSLSPSREAAERIAAEVAREIRPEQERIHRVMSPVRYTLGDLALSPPCRWLPATVSRQAEIVVREACAALGTLEDPPGTNRGPEIDEWNRRAGVPVGSYWCAAFAGEMWRRAGVEPPPGYAACDRLMAWGRATGRWTEHVPTLGALVLYGVPGDARHVGIVVRTAPLVLSVEGNTTVEGSRLERNGTAVALKLVTADDPVLGYVHLTPLAA